MVICGSKNEYQNDMCLNEIELHANILLNEGKMLSCGNDLSQVEV